MGEEQIFTNAFDLLDVLIALAKGGRNAVLNSPNPLSALDQIPAVKELVERYDDTKPLQVFARRNINNKIKGCCKDIVSDMQRFKKAFNIVNNSVDSNTINHLIDKYKNYPQITELQANFLYEKQINPNYLIKDNILNQFLNTDYARNVQITDSLNLTNGVKPLNIIYMDCIKTSRESMMKQVGDKISGLRHQANMNGTSLDETTINKLTEELKTHQNVVKKVDKRISHFEETSRQKPYVQSSKLTEPITKVKTTPAKAGKIIQMGEKVQPSTKLKAVSQNIKSSDRPIVKPSKLKL
jgi:hypothetical protein